MLPERLIETAEQLKVAAEQQKGNATDKQVALFHGVMEQVGRTLETML